MREVEGLGSVSVEFDEYVPLTITWSGANEVLDPPVYVGMRDGDGYLELKFNPSTGILIEAVLAAISEIKIERENLSPHISAGLNLMPFIGSEGSASEIESALVIKAYSDYLYVSFGPDPDEWIGPGPILFGLTEKQRLAAICARWTDLAREAVLVGR